MVDPLRLRLLEREVELMGHFALIVADDLEAALAAPGSKDLPVLMQALLTTAIKISYLLWRFGRRVTDKHGAAEAELLRLRLGLGDHSVLAPGNVSALADAITLPAEELRSAVDGNALTLTVGGVTYPLQPLIAELRRVHGGVAETEAVQ